MILLNQKPKDFLKKQGKLDEALHHYTKAIKLNKNDGESYYKAAGVLASQGKHKQAIQYYNEAIARFTKQLGSDPNPSGIKDLLGMSYVGLGKVLLNQGNVQEASNLFSKASRVSPRLKKQFKQNPPVSGKLSPLWKRN